MRYEHDVVSLRSGRMSSVHSILSVGCHFQGSLTYPVTSALYCLFWLILSWKMISKAPWVKPQRQSQLNCRSVVVQARSQSQNVRVPFEHAPMPRWFSRFDHFKLFLAILTFVIQGTFPLCAYAQKDYLIYTSNNPKLIHRADTPCVSAEGGIACKRCRFDRFERILKEAKETVRLFCFTH